MSRVCDLTGKRPVSGNSVSHSHVKTKRKFYPNLQKKKFFITEEDRWIMLKVTTKAIRTINKKGIYSYMQELKKAGVLIKQA